MPSLAAHISASPRSAFLGSYVMLPSRLAASTIGSTGFDWALIDMEHSPLSASDATALVHAVAGSSRGGILPFVRVPSHGVEHIKWALDSGASGVVVPMVQSAEEARAIVRHGRYPPQGQRSFGPFHAPYADFGTGGGDEGGGGMDKYFSQTARDVAIIPMIESVLGVENAEEILGVPGLSGAFVGPVDLRLSMGFSGAHSEEDEYIAALEKIADAGRRIGLPVGIFAADASLLPRLKEMGYSFFLLGGDVMFLTSGAGACLRKAEQALLESKL